MLSSVGYIDQTLYANEGNRADLTWRNDEVVELLNDLRAMILADVEQTLDGVA